MKVLQIEWIDASIQPGEVTVHELEQLVCLVTVGFLVKETKEAVSIAHERCDEDGTFRNVSHIPKASIVKRKTLS